MVEPYHPLYNNLLYLYGTKIPFVKPGQRFHYPITKFGKHSSDFLPHQVVRYESQLTETIVESNTTHAEMLGLIPGDADTKVQKRNVDDRDIDTVNKNFADKKKSIGASTERMSRPRTFTFPHEK